MNWQGRDFFSENLNLEMLRKWENEQQYQSHEETDTCKQVKIMKLKNYIDSRDEEMAVGNGNTIKQVENS